MKMDTERGGADVFVSASEFGDIDGGRLKSKPNDFIVNEAAIQVNRRFSNSVSRPVLILPDNAGDGQSDESSSELVSKLLEVFRMFPGQTPRLVNMPDFQTESSDCHFLRQGKKRCHSRIEGRLNRSSNKKENKKYKRSHCKGKHDRFSRGRHDRSRSRGRHNRSRSRGRHDRSRSRGRHDRSRSRGRHDRSRSRGRHNRSRSRGRYDRSCSKENLFHSQSQDHDHLDQNKLECRPRGSSEAENILNVSMDHSCERKGESWRGNLCQKKIKKCRSLCQHNQGDSYLCTSKCSGSRSLCCPGQMGHGRRKKRFCCHSSSSSSSSSSSDDDLAEQSATLFVVNGIDAEGPKKSQKDKMDRTEESSSRCLDGDSKINTTEDLHQGSSLPTNEDEALSLPEEDRDVVEIEFEDDIVESD